MTTAGVNGAADGELSAEPIEVAFPLPRAPQTNIYLQLRDNGPNILLFLTTASTDSVATPPLGTFVYAMPNRVNPSGTFSTPLFTQTSTIDFTTRLAKVLARKLGKPVYVGNSMSFANAGMGGTVEEEMEGFKQVVEVVVKLLNEGKVSDGTN
ncbi:hypothetical protein DM02DRAFT_527605 [Periconia macrospinosa]|uniref:Proteasome assembly chaperone 3 n=1 Tax=Periconia macrospinosa TaxID=97972 RepID=A0A2V1DQM2_9PLEO|nr:hypothetical protein DM02DRAFT_527605 [Periconia macrospinosa]